MILHLNCPHFSITDYVHLHENIHNPGHLLMEVCGTVPDAPLPCSERVFVGVDKDAAMILSIKLAEWAMKPATPKPTRTACDGNHRGPRCSDPQCWHGDDPPGALPVVPASEQDTGKRAWGSEGGWGGFHDD